METTSFGRVLGLWAAGLGAAAQFGKVSVSYPLLAEHYGSTGAALGFAVSLVGFVGVIFGVTAGLIVARVGYRRALLAALGLGVLMSAYQASLPALPLFLVSRAFEGASHLAIVVAAPTLIAQISAPQHRGFTLSLWSTFFGVAFAFLVLVGEPLARLHGVGALFGAHAIYMAVMAGLIAVALPRDVIGPRDVPLSLGSVLRDHGRIYSSPSLSAPALGWVCYAAAWVATLTIMPLFMAEESRALIVAAMPLAGIATSMTLGVWLLRRVPAVQVILTGFACSFTASVLIWLTGAGWSYLMLAMSLGLVQGASFTAIPQLNPTPQGQAMANGALAQMGNLGNTLGTPVLALLVAGQGRGGFMIFAGTVFACGFGIHLLLSRLRARNTD
ncbi:MAG: MFS transporter [Heliomarina sp.]|uniref:MFS transporter n=1 Tax=Heliomarina sp. TaxID=2917556 RepID=UPI00405995DC